MYRSSPVNIRPLPAPRQRMTQPQPVRNQSGFIRLMLLLVVAGVLVWTGMAISGLTKASADAPVPEIRSGKVGYCLDDYRAGTKPGSIADAYDCNGTPSQQFEFNGTSIERSGKYCLAANNHRAVIAICSRVAAQSWSADGVGLMNNGNNQCLSLPEGRIGVQLITTSCSGLNLLRETWTPGQWPGMPLEALSSLQCNQTNLGDRVACVAQNQWLAWETEPGLHRVLLSDYTDGNPTEEWCADFVSYVYQQAGSPFANGERSGWDEYDANNIQYQGFTYHDASSGYIPQPGDVAYFDYAGGHVEIVVNGGRHPTFIYGDSGTIDPSTNNGDMAQNQIINDGAAGQLLYYLSPTPGV